MAMCPARRLSSHCKAGSSSEYSKAVFEHRERVRLCKTSTTHNRREIIFHESHLLTTFVPRHYVPARSLFRTVFSLRLHISRCGFYWHVLSKQRPCPLIAGFSLIRA